MKDIIGKTSRTWDDEIETDLEERGRMGVDLIQMVQSMVYSRTSTIMHKQF